MRQSGVQIRSPKFTGFVWNTKREEAALHVAHDRLTDEAIAKVAGISKRTLEKWKLLPEFRIRVYEHRERERRELEKRGLRERANRLQAKQRRWTKLEQIVEERGADPEMQTVPGGKTGFIVRQIKQLGAGPSAQIVEEYAVDTGLLRAFDKLEQDTAIEIGEWNDKGSEAGSPIMLFQRVLIVSQRSGMTPEEIIDTLSPEYQEALRPMLQLQAAKANA